jgi:branched-chain amino acid transport system substrate-binding protein
MTKTHPTSPTGFSRRRMLAAGAALAVLPAPYVRSQPVGPIRVGFPVPLTGAYREEALDQVRGAKVAIAMFNEQGGLAGRKAELLVRDDKFDPAVAIAMTHGLIEKDQADFIVGGLSASVQLAMNNVAKQKKVLFNSISQSDAIVALPDWAPTTFHQALTPHVTAGSVGRYVFANFGKRVAFLIADYAYGYEMLRGFEAIGKTAGIEVVAKVQHPLGTTDFSPYFPTIQASKPDVLILCNFGRDQQMSIVQADKIGLKNSMRLVAPILLYTTRVLAGSSAFEGVVGGTSYYWRLEDTIPTANVFNRRFRAMTEGRVPTSYGALGFAGVMTVLTAAKNAGSIETAKVVDTLAGMKYDLYKGPEYFRTCDHQAVQSVLIVESRATVNPNDMDVFKILEVDPPDEAQLLACADEGHK